MDFLHDINRIVQDIILTAGYPGIAFVIFLENIFPPIPSEVVLPYAGFLIADDKFNFWLMWLFSIFGSVSGAVILYYVGRWAGDPIVRGFLRRYGRWVTVSEADYDRALHFFDKYGEFIVFGGRLIPIIRSIISIPAGADHMPMPKFLAYTAAGSAIWNFALIYAGYTLGENWERVEEVIAKYQTVTIVVVGLGVVVFAAWWLNGKLRQPKPTPEAETNS